jgi:hypothetical protein
MRATSGIICLAIGLASWCFTATAGWAQGPIESLEASYRFLVSDREAQGGALFTATAGRLKGRALPLSFDDSAPYWGAHVCRQPGVICAVTDIYNPADYTLSPQPGPAGELQTERVNVHNGANIYDAAVWQIAVMLGQVANRFTLPAGQDAYALANNQNLLLKAGHCGDATKPVSGANRAVTHKQMFLYNGTAITDPEQAYTFRMPGRDWLSDDPFMGTPFASLVSAAGLPGKRPEYRPGKISWSDWKPITGENAWAFLLGPLQAAYLHHVRGRGGAFVPFQELAVQQALAMLPAFAALQAPIGAVYYAPAGTVGNQGSQPIHPQQVSVENNFSLYAGLKLLRAILQVELAGETTLSTGETRTIQRALALIETMIHGGTLGKRRTTAGLLDFFQNRAWRDGGFVQGGIANAPNTPDVWVPALEPRAVDANTWGVAALGARQVDAWFGNGAAYRAWRQVQGWGAYGVGPTLWGVGYSNQDGNGIGADGAYRQGILSAEWTAGAITMVRNMLRHYRAVADGGDPAARDYVERLETDEHAMLAGVQTLRYDRYLETDFPGKPAGYADLIRPRTLPYLYASRRAMIPFGWNANPLPSTCATAWIVLVADGYDPFGYAGQAN